MTKSLLNKSKQKVFFDLEDSQDTTDKVESSDVVNEPAHTTLEQRVESDGSNNNIAPQDGGLLKQQHKQKANESSVAPTKKTPVASTQKQLHGKASKTDQSSINNKNIISSASSIQSKEKMDVTSALETGYEASIPELCPTSPPIEQSRQRYDLEAEQLQATKNQTHEGNEQNSEPNVLSQAIQTASTRRGNDCSLGRRTAKKVYATPNSDETIDVTEPIHVSDEQTHEMPVASARRANDNVLGRRIVKKTYISPDELSPVLPDESLQLKKRTEADGILRDSIAFPWIGRTLRVAILLVAAIAMFFIVTQTASFLASVRQLSRTEQILLAIPMVVFGGIILGYIIKMLLLLGKLRVSPQIRIKALRELAERDHLRELSIEANQKAVEKLSSLLEDKKTYASEDYGEMLRKISVPEETISELNKTRLKLIADSKNLSGTTRDWLTEFNQKFQKPLDQIAKSRIQKHYIHAAFTTGISPYPLLDRLIVLQDSLAMLKELLEIYALKSSWDKSLVLLAKVILNTYLAGVIDNAAESGMDMVMDNIPEIAKNTLSKGMDTVIRKVGGKASGMITQGYLVYRLGNATIKMLRPIQDA